ncbi:uncharacterized protein PHALS_10769 [Plasmopara halstedii]|uniref:Uncharacterized protein n=1 Tax=Plasmopara halstedii TaxID=4781 RepID=A0A0P1AII2_PLAHL|nr:uncharacterized protein PHALS_10769 [Plasmopara halstedii]CEG40580.1 hypothetical protein PHALS_10769 [Plasmopara halstedii]|eukprot:XP_024576949.1 hypothetical protein PHALS_10769 [Plasmopara halstedii]
MPGRQGDGRAMTAAVSGAPTDARTTRAELHWDQWLIRSNDLVLKALHSELY